MTRWEFEELLGRHGISRHYTEQNLDEDLDYVRSHQ
jgi:predicted HTH domain antitoxin